MYCPLKSSVQSPPGPSVLRSALRPPFAQSWEHRVKLTGGCHEPTAAKGKWGFRGLWVLNLHSYFYIETFPSCAQQPCSGPWGQGPGTVAGASHFGGTLSPMSS